MNMNDLTNLVQVEIHKISPDEEFSHLMKIDPLEGYNVNGEKEEGKCISLIDALTWMNHENTRIRHHWRFAYDNGTLVLWAN